MTALRDFLDAEYALQREESAWKDAAQKVGANLLAQDGASAKVIRGQWSGDVSARRSSIQAWTRALTESGEKLSGASMVRAYVGLAWLAGIVGAVFGLTAGKAALISSAGHPINLWLFLGVLVFLQIGLLLTAFGFATWAKMRGKAWLGFLGRLSQALFRWNWLKTHAEKDLLGALAETSRVERWIWLSFTQRFAVAFNLGVIVSFLALLLFSELQFGWSTTPDGFKPTALEAVVHVLSAPWAWAAPTEWVPSPDLIAGTRWESLDSTFRDSQADGRDWWPFLLMSLIVWGLLPRVILLAWLNAKKRKAITGLTWNHRGYQRLFEIMLPLQAASPHEAVEDIAPIHTSWNSASNARRAILWGDWAHEVEEETLSQASSPLSILNLPAPGVLRAGGSGLSQDADALAALHGSKVLECWILVEAGESPDKRFTSFLSKLRAALGKDCPMHVLPLEYQNRTWPPAQERDLEVWTRTVQNLCDRQLSVSRMHAS
ncbi:MAG: DUF2868 domain-containing protein [Planctomycetota bacterium]